MFRRVLFRSLRGTFFTVRHHHAGNDRVGDGRERLSQAPLNRYLPNLDHTVKTTNASGAVTARSRNPLTWVPSVYFAMGLPFIALNLVSVIMFNNLGIDKSSIAFWTSLITLPYTLKFIWSPLLEIYWTKKNFVVATQALSGFCFALIAFLLPLPDFFAWTICAMWVIAFSGATHDIATDGDRKSVV